MDDLDGSRPSLADRLLHPVTITVGLALAIVATCGGRELYRRAEREAIAREIEPLQREWAALRQESPPRLERVVAILASAGPASEGGCAALTGVVSVIHRPIAERLATGDLVPRRGGPWWLSSDVWGHAAQTLTPGNVPALHRRRIAALRDELARPCVAVLETEEASAARTVGDRRFEGGDVRGRLRVVCLDDARVACELPIASTPLVAISVKQPGGRHQADVDAHAVDDAAADRYWREVEATITRAAPGLRVEREATSADAGP